MEVSQEERERLIQKLLDDDDSIQIGGDHSKEKQALLKQIALEQLLKGGGKLVHGGTKTKNSESGIEKLLQKKTSEVDEKKVLSVEAKAVHTANVMRIYKLVDKIEKNEVPCDIKLREEVRTLLPETEKWDFHLGDKVIIDLSMETFKFMQKSTLAWRKQLGNIRGKPGFITDVRSQYDNMVQVYFPDVLTSTAVYTGTLTKIDKELPLVPSRWKVGDYVKTRKKKEFVKKFQKRLPDIPEKWIEKKGRVIAVTQVGIFVTFNEKTSYAINPALLQIANDTKPIRVLPRNCHPKGLLIGDKVHVIRDIKKLIENQKGFGGWNWKMTSLAGKIVTITYMKKDGSLFVALKNSRCWRINYESVYKDMKDAPPDCIEDLQFMPGDKICFRLTENIKMQLVEAKVLESCLDFLKMTAIVEGIDDDFDVHVRFTQDKKFHLKSSAIRKATRQEETRYDDLDMKRRCLAKGSIVRIDAGPPRYVKDILGKSKANASTVDAITQPAQILGFTDEEHAVIQYKNKKLIKINTKYLVPKEKYEPAVIKKISFEDIYRLLQNVESAVEAIQFEHNNNSDDNSVDLYSVTNGATPTVCFKIASLSATTELISKHLEHTMGSKITYKGGNELHIEMRPEEAVDVVLYNFLNFETAKVKSLEELIDNSSSPSEPGVRKTSYQEQSNADVKAEPFMDNQPGVVIDPPHPGAAQQPQIQGWGDFRFLTFHTVGGTLYFPYIPQNIDGGNAAQGGAQNANRADNTINNNFNIGSINKFTQHNY